MVFFVNSCTFLYFCIKLSIKQLASRGVIPKHSARRSLPGTQRKKNKTEQKSITDNNTVTFTITEIGKYAHLYERGWI